MTELDLRDRLIAAHQRGDEETFLDLCSRNPDTIVRAFESWTAAPPEDIVYDQKVIGEWVHAIVTIAETLRDLGHPGALDLIRRPGVIPHPAYYWRHILTTVQYLGRAGDHERAYSVLRNLLSEMPANYSPIVEAHRLKALSLLGANSLRLGYFIEADSCATEALRCGTSSGDHTDITLNTETLDMAIVGKEIAGGGPSAADLIHVRERICTAQDLSDAGRYPASNEVLTDLLTTHPDNRYLAKIHGLLGLNFHHLKDLLSARRHTELALAKCRRANDPIGETIYTANLNAIDSS